MHYTLWALSHFLENLKRNGGLGAGCRDKADSILAAVAVFLLEAKKKKKKTVY